MSRERIDESFIARVRDQRLPAGAHAHDLSALGLTKTALKELFESQVISRKLDLAARRLGREKRGFYSIGSSGHEGNAAVARALRPTDMAFLHYRSGAFLIERARQVPGQDPLKDMALSFVASAEDPMSGGRHKVLGSKALSIPPQTSTIASHLPKAVGAAHAVALARTLKTPAEMPHDAAVLASFGDASANHSTALGAINAAAWAAYRGAPMPVLFVCEDNNIGISVPSPAGWLEARFGNMPGLHYIAADGLDLLDAWRGAREAEAHIRTRRRPVFLHLKTVRLMGHAGSDVESAYRAPAEIEADEAQDPLLHSARILIETGAASPDDILALYANVEVRVEAAMERAATRAKLTTAAQVMAPIVPPRRPPRPLRDAPPPPREPLHLSRMIAATLAQEMSRDERIVVFGEDVGRKGGVYGATHKLQERHGRARVFDTLLDEQTILGAAMGLAHNGFLPIPEIQFLAYLHNAEDQLRGEAATLSFFSNGQFVNPMVVRIAGLPYQKGFGGHFHNDNALGVLRDIPGLIVATPSDAADGARLLRECIRLAREEARVAVFIEPIALYPMRDLHAEGDGLLAAALPPLDDAAAFGEVRTFGEGPPSGGGVDVAIVTFANGAVLSRRAMKALEPQGVAARVIDIRWLAPLPVAAILKAIEGARAVLIVDETRRSGGVSEGLVTALHEAGVTVPVARETAEDSFIPLGPAASVTLPSVASITAAALRLAGAARGRDAAE